MKTRILFLTIVLVLIIVVSLGFVCYSYPFSPSGDNEKNIQEFNFDQWFSDPDKYNGQQIAIDGYYFDGFEIMVLSEKLDSSGFAEGHLVPMGRMLWVEGGIPKEIYESLQQQEMMGPTERYGQIHIKGTFEYGGKYGHLGQYHFQIIPSEVFQIKKTP